MRKGKILLAAMVMLLACGVAGLFADQSDYYYTHVPVVKVLSHSLGYRVIYRFSYGEAKDVYLPYSWFVPGGKAELILDNQPDYPYMDVYYKNGKFDHLRLYAKRNMADTTWGQIPATADLSKNFSVEDVKIEY